MSFIIHYRVDTSDTIQSEVVKANTADEAVQAFTEHNKRSQFWIDIISVTPV